MTNKLGDAELLAVNALTYKQITMRTKVYEAIRVWLAACWYELHVD